MPTNKTPKAARWPLPEFDENDQPHFLFIITSQNSGSTAMAELLNTSYKTMILQKKGEGQWLVPGMCEPDRWDPNKEINYRSVKATWLSTYQKIKRLTQNIEVVIEKSPPNMMRMEQLSAQFRDYSFLALNRNPYAICSSRLHRYEAGDKLSLCERKEKLSNMAKKWVTRSKTIKDLIRKFDVPLISYEDFCHNPSSVISMLKLPEGVSQSINPNACVKVKDYELQPIINQNERQLAMLRSEEIAHLSQYFAPKNGLLKWFGYHCL